MEKRSFQVYRQLSERIFSGMAPGDRLPPEPELCRELGVARVTLRTALAQLEAEGVILRSRSRGTFVAPFEAIQPKLLLISGTVGRAPVHITDNYFVPGVLARCEELHLQCEHVSRDMLPEQLAPEGNYRGIVISGCLFSGSEPELALARHSHLYAVNALCYRNDPAVTGMPSLMPDLRSAWFDGLVHLIRRGHRRIASLFLGDWSNIERRMNFNRDEYAAFFAGHGLASGLERFVSDDSVHEAVAELITRKDPPTAIYCYADYYAFQVCEVLRSLGVRVPEQVAVMGFSGYPGAALLRPALSTVDLHYAMIGRIAVDMVVNQVRKTVISPHDVAARTSPRRFLIAD